MRLDTGNKELKIFIVSPNQEDTAEISGSYVRYIYKSAYGTQIRYVQSTHVLEFKYDAWTLETRAPEQPYFGRCDVLTPNSLRNSR